MIKVILILLGIGLASALMFLGFVFASFILNDDEEGENE